MEPFPILKNKQVALIRADVSTGHVLDEKLELVIRNEQVVFTLFDDEISALNAAKQIITDYNFVECVIYDQQKSVIHYVRP